MRWVTDENAGLLTDLYELTMAASYHRRGMNEPASFELFVRRLPANRKFLIACGIEEALDYLEGLRFDEAGLTYLRSLEMFDEAFLTFLGSLRFSGEVWAVPEGEVAFAGEPFLRVTAPLIEAQIVETFLLNCITFQTLIASKAARVAIACEGRPFVDFSARRDHGAGAALRAARASYVGGADATSNVLAASIYGIPPSGTMAHSYVMSFGTEEEAFQAFSEDFPGRSILLVDTYDTIEGARRAARVARQMAAAGIPVRGVRLDSGDVAGLAREVRCILDESGCDEVQIFASGDLDEHRIAEIIEAGAPVDAFGVGTQLGTSADAPALGGVYKLVEDSRGARLKLSEGKETLPGCKQVFRVSRGGLYDHDVLGLADETPSAGAPVLARVMGGGRRLGLEPALAGARDRCRETLRRLPEYLKSLALGGPQYPVRPSSGLEALAAEARGRVGGNG